MTIRRNGLIVSVAITIAVTMYSDGRHECRMDIEPSEAESPAGYRKG
jgi:hypothetical protein